MIKLELTDQDSGFTDTKQFIEEKYKFKSEKLNYVDETILYSEEPNKPIIISNYFVPISSASPVFKRLTEEIEYTNTTLALCDLTIRKSKNSKPSLSRIVKIISSYWNTILYLRNQGIYNLRDAQAEDLHKLCKDYAKGGWTHALNVRTKVHSIISNMDAKTFKDSVYTYGVKTDTIDGLKLEFWKKRIGFLPHYLFDSESKDLFAKKANDFGYILGNRWHTRYKSTSLPLPPTEDCMRALLARLNNLYHLPNSVDRLSFLPFRDIAKTAKKYSKNCGNRTENLGIDEAAHILVNALEWIYNYGPKLVFALNHCRKTYISSPKNVRQNFLLTDNPFHDLANELGIPAPTAWSARKHPDVTLRTECQQTVDHLIGALQGACAIAIAGFNARRSAEVCDKSIGLRYVDLVSDSGSDLHMVNFYIEKSYQDRHLFYVNRATVDSINILQQLKLSCAPLDSSGTENAFDDDSLFSCHVWSKKRGPTLANMYSFKRQRQTKSLNAFLSFLDEEFKNIDLKSHMWRRFFGLIYIYRYDNSDIQSLSQHFRHLDIGQTMIYLTDTNARDASKKLGNKVPNIKQDKINEIRLLNSLHEDCQELTEAIVTIQEEKFKETVTSILNGEKYSGGFPRLVQKLYSSLSKKMNFSKLSESEKAEFITMTLEAKDYTARPMPHGQCNAPDNNHNFSGKCSNNGYLERDRASASFCQNCMFHSKNDSFVKNLHVEILELEKDIISENTPKFVRAQAIEAKQSLLEVIKIHTAASSVNSSRMNNLVKKYEKK